MADVRKMFLQIKIAPEDQNAHRFLWRDMDPNSEIKTYCMTRLPFGDVSSPYEAIATMHHHADQCKVVYPEAARVIKEDTYVDDCLTGCETETMGRKLYSDLVEMMKIGGFDLLKWATNSKSLLSYIPADQRASSRLVCLDNDSDPLKALGLSWDTVDDVFLFHQGDKLLQTPETKRSIISISSKLFDPLGFLSPFKIRAKILYQKLWIRGASWDDLLDEEIKNEWQKWKEELEHLNLIRISRSFLTGLGLEIVSVQLHGFSDASPSAYGAVIYLRLQDSTGNVQVQLLFAKTRVAPTKRITLPRLELMAAYLLSKMITFLLKVLGKRINQYICWSDSTITLSWIRRPSYTWKVFVANRVQAIQQNTDPECWRFCPGDTNPADFVTRGETLENLANYSPWWNGPQWLYRPPGEWPINIVDNELPECPESNPKVVCNTAVSTFPSPCIDVERSGRWIKLVRITVFVFRAVALFKGLLKRGELTKTINQTPEITAEEIKEAQTYWYQEIQKASFVEEWRQLQKKDGLPSKSPIRKLNPYFDENDKLIRVGGRLQFSELPEETKHQIILPAKHPVVDKIIIHSHETQALHAGPETTLAILRETFWILRGRRAVKRAINTCRVCRKFRIGPVQQQMAPLPAERVTYSPAFTHVGIDFTGHLILKSQKKSDKSLQKAYVCIFSCATTRMVHLELTNDMTTEEFLQALRRMYNRRGLCNTLWSDNQTTFKKAEKDIQWLFEASSQKMNKVWKKLDPSQLQRETSLKGIKWKFIIERSPHRGGWWERICRSLKEPLRKILGKALLTYTEMYTVLTDIEAVINSRPLTFIGDDIKDGQTITPAHLALGRSLKAIPDVTIGSSPIPPVSSRFLYRQSLINRFWRRWLTEYLPQLTIRQKWLEEKPPLKVGDVVLMSEDNVKRGNWPLAIVQEVHMGKDGLIRTATLQTKSGQRRRSVQKLYLLEEARSVEEDLRNMEKVEQSQSLEIAPEICDQKIQKQAVQRKKLGNVPNLDTKCQGGQNVKYSRFGRVIKAPSRLGS
ncbi:uncharacterized protein LOC114535156 [Dendronephthya gigantea]|uniref:uncharacterized protein LOC114535156 n=1 Tax=Dendronephthya gigantea TaxID=151771 RepID=UPI00106B6C56|nr:uncharacterized protein LOC114535156 [Dendronephthya gigantea]